MLGVFRESSIRFGRQSCTNERLQKFGSLLRQCKGVTCANENNEIVGRASALHSMPDSHQVAWFGACCLLALRCGFLQMAAFGRRRRGDTEAHWLYSKEFLEKGSPSRNHGISFEEECVLRELGCSVIDQLARGMYGKYV